MKNSLLASASIGVLVLASSAHAADLSRPVYKAQPRPAAPVWSWTGFYVGGTVGGVFGHSSVVDDPGASSTWLPSPTTINGSGVIGGLEAGYNWQISQVVLGLEGDISWSSLNTSVSIPMPAFLVADTFSSRLDWLGTIRGRIGWALDRVLLYGTGGVAFADLKDQLTDPANPFVAAPSSSVTGWAAGGGIEYAFSDHWTAKAEYLHVGLPNRSVFNLTSFHYAFDFTDRLDIGRLGINYKF